MAGGTASKEAASKEAPAVRIVRPDDVKLAEQQAEPNGKQQQPKREAAAKRPAEKPAAVVGADAAPVTGADHLCLRCDVALMPTVLAPFERKGFELVGAKSSSGSALLALRGPVAAVAGGRALAEDVRRGLPAGASLLVSSSTEESLEWMSQALGPRELVQWEPQGASEWLHADDILLGVHNENRGAVSLPELLAPGRRGEEAGARFCAQLRRDSYVGGRRLLT